MDYAVRIELDNTVYRFATDRLVIQENIGGQTDSGNYLPLLTSVDPPNVEMDLKGTSSVPTYGLSISDPKRKFIDKFEKFDYQDARVLLYKIDNNDNIFVDFFGYITDISFEEGLFSFELRADDDFDSDDYMERFKPDSFQYFTIRSVKDVNASLHLDLNEDCPWTVAQAYLNEPIDPITGSVSDTFSEGGGNSNRYFKDSSDLYTALDSHIANFIEDLLRQGRDIYVIHDPGGTGEEVVRVNDIENPSSVNGSMHSGYVVTDELPNGETWDSGDNYEIFELPDSHIPAVSYKHARIRGFERDPDSNDIITINLNMKAAENYCLDFRYESASARPDYISGIKRKLFHDEWPDGTANPAEFLLGESNDPDHRKITAIISNEEEGGDEWLRLSKSSVSNPNWPDDEVLERMASENAPVRPVTRPDTSDFPLPNNKDMIIVQANGFIPFDEDDDPSSAVGYIDAGESKIMDTGLDISNPQAQDGDIYRAQEIDVRLIHRFKMINQSDTFINGVDTDSSEGGFLGLEIHNETLPFWRHQYASDFPEGQYTIPDNLELNQSIKFVASQYTVGFLEFFINGVSGSQEIFNENNGEYTHPDFENRLRGKRIDLLRPFGELNREFIDNTDGYDETDPSTYKDYNDALLGLGTDKFAVCNSSEVFYSDGDWFERVYFDKPDDYENPLRELEKESPQTDSDGNVIENESVYEYDALGDKRNFINKMTYKPFVKEAIEYTEEGFSIERAREYFKSKNYRVIKNSVPQNSDQLGNYYPIVYGHVRKVPLMRVISTHVSEQEDKTAGDDIYIISANNIGISNPADIDVFVQERSESNELSDREEHNLETGASRKHLIESPFPKVVDEHYVELEAENESTITHHRFASVGKLFNPYHKLIKIKTYSNYDLNALQLRGNEYNSSLGPLDKRYPIKNGVGKSGLFGSYAGQVDTEGEYRSRGSIIQNPVNIIRHFIENHSDVARSLDIIDHDSFDKLVSKISKYRMGAWIDEPLKVGEFISNICKQCAIGWYWHRGNIKVTDLDLDNIDYTKPISESINLLNKISETQKGYRDLYNEIEYQYNYNYMSGKFENSVILNKKNNKYCRMAEKAKGQKETLSIEAKWIYNSWVAKEVALKHALFQSSRKRFFQLELKPDVYTYEPGDVVPLTYNPYGFENEPVFVRSVNEGRFVDQIEVVHFPDYYKKEIRETELVSSKPPECQSGYFDPTV